MNVNTKRVLTIFGIPVISTYIVWLAYMSFTQSWYLFAKNFFMTITMVFGSFVAGASSEGGGAVAFPVMTLVFKIHPAEARTFSLAIQSIGMVAASLWIIAWRLKIETTYLKLGFIGGTAGLVLGTFFIAPYTAPAYSKMLFVSFWLSFGIVLFVVNYYRQRFVQSRIPALNGRRKAELIFVGLIGGILSSLLGSGIDICTFAFVTMKYNLSEKIATPTSVVLMASNAVIGFLLHRFIVNDVQPEVYHYWLVCIPVVAVGAPLGAFVVSKARRLHIVNFLCSIIVIQFIGAMLIIRPTGKLLYFSLVSFLAGILIFFLLTRNAKNSVVPQKS